MEKLSCETWLFFFYHLAKSLFFHYLCSEMKPPLTREAVSDPHLWRLTLMLRPHAVEVAIMRTVGDHEVISAHIPLESESDLEEAVYANPLLLAPFAHTDILVDTDSYTVVPAETARDAAAVEALRDIITEKSERLHVYTDHIDRSTAIIFTLAHSTANFISRTFGQVVPRHPLGVLARFFGQRARRGNTGKIFVHLTADTVEVIAFDTIGIAALTSFDTASDTDAAYYILAAARTAGLDVSRDEFLLAGDSTRRTAVSAILRKYASTVLPAVFPAAMHHASGLDIPFQLIVLPLCE